MDAFTGVFYNFFTVRFEGDFNVKQRKEKEINLKTLISRREGYSRQAKKDKGKIWF